MTVPSQTEPDVRQEISREFVHLQKEFYGKGPEKARTLYSGDIVLVVMRGGFTAVESTLLESGRGDAVIQQRMAFQDAMEGRFRQIVETHTGRPVIAFMNGSHQGPDILAVLFVLEPRSIDDLLS